MLLNADRAHEAPRKAARSLQKEVGQNIKDKNGMELTKAEDIKKRWQGVVLRWWRNRMGDHFSPTNSSKDHLNAEKIPHNNF